MELEFRIQMKTLMTVLSFLDIGDFQDRYTRVFLLDLLDLYQSESHKTLLFDQPSVGEETERNTDLVIDQPF